MSYDNNFSYNLPSPFPYEKGNELGDYSSSTADGFKAYTQQVPAFEFKPGNFATISSNNNGFDAKGLTEELKVSAETASFATGAFGAKTNMFSNLTTSNKITPVAYYLDNKDVYENLYSGVGVSRFETVKNLATDEDRLANSQTTGQRIGYGLTKASQNFAKVFIQNTAGAVYGIGSAVANQQWSKLYDNDFTDALDDWNTVSRYKLGNYKSDQEKQMSFFQKMGTANFWADDFAQGLSFTLGTIASEFAWAGLTGGGGIFASAYARGANALSGATRLGRIGEQAASMLTSAANVGRNAERTVATGARVLETAAEQANNVLNAGRKTNAFLSMKALSNIKDGSQIARSIYTSSAMEAGMEAKQAYRDSYDSFIQGYINRTGKTPNIDEVLKFDEDARMAANRVFAANIPVVALSNIAQFSSIFGLNFVSKMGIGKAIGSATGFNKFIGLEAKAALKDIGKVAGKDAFKVSRLGRITGVLAPKVGTALTEGVWEEGTQGILQGTAKNWLASRYNVDRTKDNLSVMESVYDAMAHQYGSKEGREEMYLGMLIGVFGNNVSQAIQRKSAAPLVTGFFRSGNAEVREQNAKMWDTLSEEVQTIGKSSVEENFSKVYNNAINNVLLKNQQDENTERAKEALTKGQFTEANIFKMNAEFAKHFGTFYRMQDSVDFSFEDLMMQQIEAMDVNEIAKEHGVTIEEATAAKEGYKTEVKKQVSDVLKFTKHAEALLNVAGKHGEEIKAIVPFLANQLYVASGLDTSMNEISKQIGELWNKNDSFFASRFRLLDELSISHEIDLDNYSTAKEALDEAKVELDKLNNELPALTDKDTLDENGNVKIASERQTQIEEIQKQTAKVNELQKDLDNKLERLNNLRFINMKTRFGGVMDSSADYNNLTHADIEESFNALESLDVYKKELLANKNTKPQGVYLHNLLEEYGKSLTATQNISMMYDELASAENKNLVSFALRLKGSDIINDFQETEEEKQRLDNVVSSIEERILKGKTISDKTEARTILRTFLRAGVNLQEKRLGREKDLVRVYDYKEGKYRNQSAVLSDINEPVQSKQWSIYNKEGLRKEKPVRLVINNKEAFGVEKSVHPELEEISNEIIRKVSRKIPLSNREQIIYNENKGFFDYESKKFRKNPTDNIETFESVVEKYRKRKEDSRMYSRQEYMDNVYVKKEGSKENPEREFLEEKIQRKLNNLQDFKESGIDLPAAVQYVEGFSEKDIERYLYLKSLGTLLSLEQQAEFNELEDKLRVIGEFQGTSTEDSSNLLDDVRQLAQILRFENDEVNNQLSTVDNKEVADTENEFKASFRTADGGDLSVAQNYSKGFVAKKEYDGNTVIEISNVTPHTFASNINATVLDATGKQVEIKSLEDRQFINQPYKLVLKDSTVINFSINERGNLVFSETEGEVQKLKDNTNYLLEAVSAFSKQQPLLFIHNGEVLYVNSDFTNNDSVKNEEGKEETVFNVMNQEAIENLKPGEELIIVYPENNTWNKSLKKGTETNKEGLLMLYTKDGEFVGVLKSAREKEVVNNKNAYFNIRKMAFENGKKYTTFVNEKLGHKDTGLRLPVELVWHGHPNFKMTMVDGKVEIEQFDFNENSVQKVSNIGYVQNGKIVDKEGDEELNLTNQYYMTATIRNNPNKKVPFVVIDLNGRKVMYPISLKVLENNPNELVDEILNNNALTNGEKVEQLNNLLHKFNVPHTSFFFNNASLTNEGFINDVKQRLVDSDLYGDVTTWNDDRSIEEILTNEASINIDLNDTPFHSPKIKFSITGVRNENALEEEIVVEEEEAEEAPKKEAKTKRPRIKNGTRVRKIASVKGFETLIKEIKDKMDALPGKGVTIKNGQIIESPEYVSLKSQLDDVAEKYNQFLKNKEGKKRGSSAVKKKAEEESKKNCKK